MDVMHYDCSSVNRTYSTKSNFQVIFIVEIILKILILFICSNCYIQKLST